MKLNVLKTGMPIMAFMLAIAFAFASEKKTNDNDSSLITGYVLQSGLCVSSSKDCNNINTIPCTDDFGRQVHQFRLSDTVCSEMLYHWPF
jgi:hypothetical protein